MKTELTRRELTACLPAMLAPQALSGQRVAGQGEPLESARKRLGEAVRKLEAFELPMAVEPAFIFKP
jgi:hypothetical protein